MYEDAFFLSLNQELKRKNQRNHSDMTHYSTRPKRKKKSSFHKSATENSCIHCTAQLITHTLDCQKSLLVCLHTHI